jgi:hypothetical protein
MKKLLLPTLLLSFCLSLFIPVYANEELKTDIDLFAPISKNNTECRFPKGATGCEVKDENSPFCYTQDSPDNCIKKGGQPVTRIETDAKAESILNTYIGIIFSYAFGLGVGF